MIKCVNTFYKWRARKFCITLGLCTSMSLKNFEEMLDTTKNLGCPEVQVSYLADMIMAYSDNEALSLTKLGLMAELYHWCFKHTVEEV